MEESKGRDERGSVLIPAEYIVAAIVFLLGFSVFNYFLIRKSAIKLQAQEAALIQQVRSVVKTNNEMIKGLINIKNKKELSSKKAK